MPVSGLFLPPSDRFPCFPLHFPYYKHSLVFDFAARAGVRCRCVQQLGVQVPVTPLWQQLLVHLPAPEGLAPLRSPIGHLTSYSHDFCPHNPPRRRNTRTNLSWTANGVLRQTRPPSPTPRVTSTTSLISRRFLLIRKSCGRAMVRFAPFNFCVSKRITLQRPRARYSAPRRHRPRQAVCCGGRGKSGDEGAADAAPAPPHRLPVKHGALPAGPPAAPWPPGPRFRASFL